QRMTTEPPACLAHFPVSTMISLPPITAVSRTNGIRVLSVFTSLGPVRGLVPLSKSPTVRGARRNDQTSATPERNDVAEIRLFSGACMAQPGAKGKLPGVAASPL